MIAKKTRSGLSSVEVSWGVSASVRVLLTHCNLVPRSHSVLHVAVGDLGTRLNPLYFPLKEIAVITTFVRIVNKFIGP